MQYHAHHRKFNIPDTHPLIEFRTSSSKSDQRDIGSADVW